MQGIDQTVDGLGAILLGDIGEVGVQRGGGGAGVAKQGLDMTQAQALLKQMGGPTVAQRMD